MALKYCVFFISIIIISLFHEGVANANNVTETEEKSTSSYGNSTKPSSHQNTFRGNGTQLHDLIQQLVANKEELIEGRALIRSPRGGLLGLPLPTQTILTSLLITLNNLLAQLGLTVVIMPSPFPFRLAKCVPGCLRNPGCIGAITDNGGSNSNYGGGGTGGLLSGGGDPVSTLLGGLLGGLKL